MKKHKAILVVEVYVDDDQSPEICAQGVVDSLKDYIGHGGLGDPQIADSHVVSVDKEPLPPTEDELKEVSRLSTEKAQFDEFLAKTPLGTFVVVGHFFRGTLSDVQPDIVSILDRRGFTRTWSRHDGSIHHIMAEDLHCGHGRSRMDLEECVECNRNVRYVIEGIFKRDVM